MKSVKYRVNFKIEFEFYLKGQKSGDQRFKIGLQRIKCNS